MAKPNNPDYDILNVRIPLIGDLTFRGTAADKDQRFVNGFFDVQKNPITEKTYFNFVKRPGLTQTNGIRPPAGNATARGHHAWNGKIYSVYGDKIYSNSTDLGVTLTTTTGRCGITSTRSGAGTRYLGINDGVKLYLISTSDVVSTITTNFPTPNTRDLVYMDGYFFVLKSNGIHYHCTVDDPTSWDTSKFLTAQMYNSDINEAGIGLARLGNYLVQFGGEHTQIFYDAANSSGSALANVEQSVSQYGCSSTDSIQWAEGKVIWVANHGHGSHSVQMLTEGAGMKEVSTPAICRILDAEGTSISSALATTIQVGGHHFYMLSLSSSNRTFVLDIETQLWTEWQEAGSTNKWPIINACHASGRTTVQHATNGWIYVIDPAVYQDDSTNFSYFWRTSRVDFDTMKYKFMKSLDVVGDKASATANLSFQYSDDDWTTLSTARTIDMSLTRPYITRLGMFRRRSFQGEYSGNLPMRIEAIEVALRSGEG